MQSDFTTHDGFAYALSEVGLLLSSVQRNAVSEAREKLAVLSVAFDTLFYKARANMRERCAKAADAYNGGLPSVRERIAESIRALPINDNDADQTTDQTHYSSLLENAESLVEYFDSYVLALSDHDEAHQQHFLKMARAWSTKVRRASEICRAIDANRRV